MRREAGDAPSTAAAHARPSARCCRSGWPGSSGSPRWARSARCSGSGSSAGSALRRGRCCGCWSRCAAAVGVLASPSACADRAGCAVLALAGRSRSLALFVGYWLSGAGAGAAASRATGTSCCPGSAAACRRSGPCGCRTSAPTRGRGSCSSCSARELLILAGLLTFWPRSAVGAGRARAADAARARLPVRRAGGADRRRRLAGRLARRDGASLLLGLALAALTVCFLWLERLPLRPGLGVAGLLAVALVGRAADRGGGRPRRAVVRLPLVRREPRPRRPGALLVDAELRADHLAARRQRGHARSSPASRCTGRRATSTSSTDSRGRRARTPRRHRRATSRSRPTCPRTGRDRPAWTSDDRGLDPAHADPPT